jgi:outer membrane receptor protein involved in Fe transport
MAVRLKSLCLAGVAAVTCAPAAFAQQPTSSRPAPTVADDAMVIDEIVVTAQKRTQRLLDVPQSISVVSGDTLERQQATTFADYVSLVPGLSIQQTTPGNTRVVLRGINTGGASPTVAVYVDETPFGSSTGQSNAAGLAGDIDTFDIERVEVLRGPQGTLYGANSLGGVLKYITAAPKLGKFEARGQAGVEAVKGGGTGWSANGVVNVPIGEKIAVRASGFYRRNPGFIDTIGVARKDPNDVDSYGGRASILLQPTETLSVRLTALAQNIRANSQTAFDADPETLTPQSTNPITGDPIGSRLSRAEFYPERNDVDYRLYTGTLNWDFGFANLTSITSYGKLHDQKISDVTYQLPGVADAIFGTEPGTRGLILPTDVTQKKFTQEVRIASPDSDKIEWLVGGYYTREKGRIVQSYAPFVIPTGALVDPALTLPAGPNGEDVVFPEFLRASLDSIYKEYAGFGSATWHVTPRFDITGGLRYSHNKQSTVQFLDGSFLPLSGAAIGPDVQDGGSSENVFTWSASPRFELSDHASIYVRVAKGYRPGGPDLVPPGADATFPRQFQADTLISYEAGLRAETADRSFAIDASVYYLDWRNIQTSVTYQTSIGRITADGNGDKARSKGAEVTATLRPTRGLDVMFNVAYNDAKLKDDLPAIDIGLPDPVAPGVAGDRLPYAPEWTANLSANYEWALSDRTTVFVGGDVHLISDQATDFDAVYRTVFGRRIVIDGYATVDLRAGIQTGPFNVTLFARNLNNALGLTNAGQFGTRPGTLVTASPISPRTFGATAGFAF